MEGEQMSQSLVMSRKRLEKNFGQSLLRSPDFVRCLSSKIIEKLSLQEDDRFVDLGCGIGTYAMDILTQVPLRHPVVAVDPSDELLDRIPARAHIGRINFELLEFAACSGTYDKFLMKDTINYVDDERLLFFNLHQRLSDNGKLLLVNRSPEAHHPLFMKAQEQYQQSCTDSDRMTALLEEMGFDVERDCLEYTHEIRKEEYLKLVGTRYLTVLLGFSPQEMHAGLRELEESHADRSHLKIADRYDFLTATKA
jgi:SAM-dependent methyltransferase